VAAGSPRCTITRKWGRACSDTIRMTSAADHRCVAPRSSGHIVIRCQHGLVVWPGLPSPCRAGRSRHRLPGASGSWDRRPLARPDARARLDARARPDARRGETTRAHLIQIGTVMDDSVRQDSASERRVLRRDPSIRRRHEAPQGTAASVWDDGSGGRIRTYDQSVNSRLPGHNQEPLL